jgi:transcriptional regulator with GAF, ATPase, and Fis domain
MLKLIQGIASQTSIAVANLIANEELSEKEIEKSTLLELSSEIAKIRNKSDLQKIIDQKIRKLLHISHYAVCLIDEDEKGYSLFINDENAITKAHKDYAYATSSISLNKPGLMSVALTSRQPVVFDLNEVVKIPEIPDIFKINHEMGIKEVVFSSLDDSKRKIGFLVLFYYTRTGLNVNGVNLIKGISAQLSIAITNIISNERIVAQLDEISKYKRQLEEENQYLQDEIHTTHNYSEIIGSDKSMETIFRLVSQVADTNSSVLILGETGTGKELIARAIHNSSVRKDKVMVKVNCASLPANLVESELFGHERGSFTGATERRIGKFELANNSTLFLDEIGELPLDLQVKLLRALQEKEIERVGGKGVIRTNVRIIAATNRNLKKEVQLGNFRSDLYFRLNVFPIVLPALRDRKIDIPELAQHFLAKYRNKASKVELKFSSRVIKQLVAYQWPGNVRELEHLIERSILLTSGPIINQIDLPDIEGADSHTFPSAAHIKTLGENEREYIISILKKCNGKIAGVGGAADQLKMPSTTLNSKIAKLKINKGLIQLKTAHTAKQS